MSFQGVSLWKKISPQSSTVSTARLIFASFFDRFAQQRYQLTQIESFDRVSHVMARSRPSSLSYETSKLSNSKKAHAQAFQRFAHRQPAQKGPP